MKHLHRYDKVQCVAACNAEYKKLESSNYGNEITHIAPGENIWTASNQNNERVVPRSGTSFASPGLAGIMAIYVGYEKINDNVDLILQRVEQNSQLGLLGGDDFAPGTADVLPNHGIKNPAKDPDTPYAGAPLAEVDAGPFAGWSGTGLEGTMTTTEPVVTSNADYANATEGPLLLVTGDLPTATAIS
jgi:hypothetical protein